MVVNNRFITGINRIPPNNSPVKKNEEAKSDSFGSILEQKLNASEIKFSKHAEMRLKSRNITLSSEQKEKMLNAISRAGSKGVKDSLVMMDDIAFVVNVPSKTVITAVNSKELKENVFTNIDGAVFA